MHYNTLKAHTPLPHQLHSNTPHPRPDRLSEVLESIAAGCVGGVEMSC